MFSVCDCRSKGLGFDYRVGPKKSVLEFSDYIIQSKRVGFLTPCFEKHVNTIEDRSGAGGTPEPDLSSGISDN